MEAADQVRIKNPGTDLKFSIKDIPIVKCDGKRNIPDGEVYTAPLRDSINGTVTFNTPSLHKGISTFCAFVFVQRHNKDNITCPGKRQAVPQLSLTTEPTEYCFHNSTQRNTEALRRFLEFYTAMLCKI